jgi:cysteine-rich repeat protein
VNPSAPDDVVSSSVCAGPGTDAGRPCTSGPDCDSGVCDVLPLTATSFCDVSGTPCDLAPCPGGETCITCPDPACGDGVLDPGEACDLGPSGPGNGCDANCAVESCFTCDGPLGEPSSCFQLGAGESCDLDGRPCTADTCDFSGTCQPGGAPTACVGALAAKAKVKIKRDAAKPSKAKLKWKWATATPFDVGSFGFPSTVDDLSLCAYDQSGLVFEATAPAGGSCAGKPCWTLTGMKVGYKDKEATPDGLIKAKAKSGDTGKGKILVAGKGENLAAPTLPLATPVRVLLMRGQGPLCWEATYSAPDTNDPGQFKATN